MIKQKWISSCYEQIIFHAVSAVKASKIWKYLKSTIKQKFRIRSVIIKLFFCSISPYALEMYEGVELQFHISLTSILHGNR